MRRKATLFGRTIGAGAGAIENELTESDAVNIHESLTSMQEQINFVLEGLSDHSRK